MIDNWTELALDPIYDTVGVAAVLTLDDTVGTTIDLTVIDKTVGVTVPDKTLIETVKPGACVRVSELTDNGLTRADLSGLAISFNSGDWTIKAAHPRPSPNGESDGEYLLVLSEA